MSLRTALVVVLALIFGGSAAMGINLLLNQGMAGPKPDTVSVVVTAVDVSRGMTITADLVKVREWPPALVPDGAVKTVEDAVDRVAFVPLAKGEALLDNRLTAKGAGRGMAALIPPGMRAFTIQTPSVAAGVAGFIMPGNKVDVLLTVSSLGNVALGNDPTGGGTTTTLLQNIEILAVDQRVVAPADNKVDPKELRSVTLLVTPDQAAKLDLGQNKGILHLSLRNPEDTEAARTRPATLADLRFHQEKPWGEQVKGFLDTFGKLMPKQLQAAPAVPEPAPMAHIRTLRGTSEGVVLIQPLQAPSTGR